AGQPVVAGAADDGVVAGTARQPVGKAASRQGEAFALPGEVDHHPGRGGCRRYTLYARDPAVGRAQQVEVGRGRGQREAGAAAAQVDGAAAGQDGIELVAGERQGVIAAAADQVAGLHAAPGRAGERGEVHGALRPHGEAVAADSEVDAR